LVNRFVDRWKDKDQTPSVVSKIKSIGKPSVNLKQQIIVVTQRIDLQTKTLDNAVKRFQSRDVDIFNSVVKALSKRDAARANILATELSEIRKVEKMLTHTSLALQSVSMRLNTVSEMGDLVAVLSPAKSLLNNISLEMSSILPEASQELGNIGNLLSEIVTTTNQSTDVSVDVGRANPEAEKILAEAELLAAKRLEDQLPEVAAGRLIKKLTNVEADGQIEYSS
jgi:division protein CdvB (Snf7/Vps24/ESCRT-III family)